MPERFYALIPFYTVGYLKIFLRRDKKIPTYSSDKKQKCRFYTSVVSGGAAGIAVTARLPVVPPHPCLCK
jgi:hypothetical protein